MIENLHLLLVLLAGCLLGGLAGLQVVRLLSEAEITRPFRNWLLNGGPQDPRYWGAFEFAGRAISCPFCCSWWVGPPVLLLWAPLDPLHPALLGLALLAQLGCQDLLRRLADALPAPTLYRPAEASFTVKGNAVGSWGPP